MSTLLEQASLVMIPSGYKEDIVYSQIPTSGAGDLSFTRASNGTRVNSAGLVEVCPWNLLQQSENYSVSPWSRSYITVTPNDIVAPNGTTTGNKIVLNNSGSQRYRLQQGVTTNTSLPMTFTFYAKKNQIDTFVGVIGGASGMSYEVQFNLTNGTATEVYNSSGINTAKSIESVGNGWYKCTITAGSSSGLITGVNIFKDTTGNAVDSFYIWGTQFNFGSTAKPYFPTTDRLNVPRLTYQNGGGGCPSLLLEKQSTNVETWSEDFSNASWTKTNCSITANTTTSPDGTQNADKIIENSVNGVHFTFNVGATLSVAQTLSVYAKADTRTQLALQLGASSVIYNLSNGTIVSGSGGAIVNAGNGWYRCSITTTPANTNALIFTANGGTNSYQGDGTSGLFIWGAQLEASSYATSYIPTTSSSATRVADECVKTGISSLIGQTEGTLFAILTSQQAGTSSSWWNLGDNSGLANWVFIGKDSTKWRAYIRTGGTVHFDNQATSIVDNTPTKIALAYKSGDNALYINGVQVATNSATFTFSANMGILTTGYTGSPTVSESMQTSELVLFPTRLTNSELAQLTA